jgi:phosphatidylglycerophosphate synthase
MSKKPWGIFIPQKIQKIIYPKEKIEYEGPYILATISRRISVILTYYILNRIKIRPNSVSIFSILVSFLCLIFFINSNYVFGSLLACFWVLLDNIDGELARLQNSTTTFGATLERINSDIFYIFLFPSLSIGLFQESLVDFKIVVLTFFSTSIFNVLRVFLANYPKKIISNKINSKLSDLIECQFKNSFQVRKKSKIGSFIFYAWRNVYSQCGISEISLLIFSLLSVNYINYLPSIIIFYCYSYLIISITIFLGLICVSYFKTK